jgi:hypothetical protein
MVTASAHMRFHVVKGSHIGFLTTLSEKVEDMLAVSLF